MQRSITNKKSLASLLGYFFLFVIYESLSSIYLFLPPMFAVLFLLFANALKSKNNLALLFVSLSLVLFETDRGYMLFSSLIYFVLIYKFILPKLQQNFSCQSCIKISYVLLAYLGFFFFTLLLSNIFLIPVPSINYYIVYYIVIEFFLVSIL